MIGPEAKISGARSPETLLEVEEGSRVGGVVRFIASTQKVNRWFLVVLPQVYIFL